VSVIFLLSCGGEKGERSQKKKIRENLFFAYRAKPLFSPLSPSLFDRARRCTDARIRSTPNRGNKEQTRVDNSRFEFIFARIGDRSRLQLASRNIHPRAHQIGEEKRYGIKERTFEILRRDARARILESIERTTRTTRTKKKQQRSVTSTHLDLGGLEAGDGRDLLSSSKHYCISCSFCGCIRVCE
jgi:hypothetical protein